MVVVVTSVAEAVVEEVVAAVPQKALAAWVVMGGGVRLSGDMGRVA